MFNICEKNSSYSEEYKIHMKKLLSLILSVLTAVCVFTSCAGRNVTVTKQTTARPTIGTLPPETVIPNALHPGAIKYVADKNHESGNAIRIDRFLLTYVDLIIPDKYMDIDGKIYTVTAVGVATGHPVYASGDLMISLTVIGGETARIGATAFQGAEHLSKVTLGEGVRTVGDYAFYLCTELSTLSLPETLTSIGAAAFNRTAIEEIIIPSGVTSIGRAAFANCPNLTKVTMPSSFNDPMTLKQIFADTSGIEFTFTD